MSTNVRCPERMPPSRFRDAPALSPTCYTWPGRRRSRSRPGPRGRTPRAGGDRSRRAKRLRGSTCGRLELGAQILMPRPSREALTGHCPLLASALWLCRRSVGVLGWRHAIVAAQCRCRLGCELLRPVTKSGCTAGVRSAASAIHASRHALGRCHGTPSRAAALQVLARRRDDTSQWSRCETATPTRDSVR